jgi:hypothetical protein
MMKRLLLFVVILVVLISLGGCAGREKQDGQVRAPDQAQAAVALKGITMTPKSFAQADFTDFIRQAKMAGDVIAWSGDWDELGAAQNGGPVVTAELASRNGMAPLISVQFFSQSTGELIRPLDGPTRERYKNSAAAFAGKYKPRYLALGIEVNVLYEKSPGQFDEFVGLYHEVYAAVKEQSPGTMVFPVFQLEKMKGFGGGLFGGTNDPAQAEWFLLDRFPDADLIGFTTYPCLIYKDPSGIPPDYYSEIGRRTGKPVAFTEIGWHRRAGPAGWESSDAEQAGFVTAFFKGTGGLDCRLAIWSFLYDQNVPEPFSSMGLRNSDGSARPAWENWVSAQMVPGKP